MTAIELKQWRAKAGLSRAELGAKLKVSARTVEAWEQTARQRPIPPREIERLHDLMRQDVLNVPTTPELRAKLNKLAKERGLDPAQWAAELLAAALPLFLITLSAFVFPR